MGDAQEVQSWKPEEQPKLVPAITRGFKLIFSQTAAISLCKAQGVMDMVFMAGLHFSFPPSPPSATEESLFHCCLNSPTVVFVAAATPKSTLLYLSWEECLASKSHLLATSKWPEWWCSVETLLRQLALLADHSWLLEGKSGEHSSSSALPNLLPIPVPSPTTHSRRSRFKQGWG